MQMEVLVLKPKHFHLIDRFIRPIIVNGYRSKVQERERIGNLKKEGLSCGRCAKACLLLSNCARRFLRHLGASPWERRAAAAELLPSGRPGTVGASRTDGRASAESEQSGLVKRTNMPSLGRTTMSGLSTESVGAAMSSTSIAATASTTGISTGKWGHETTSWGT